jgi:transposase
MMAAILVLARLCEPSSELHIAEDWFRRTALDDLLGVPVEKVNEDRLYRALDQLHPHKADLERHLKERLAGMFSVSYDLLLYDMTSTYFEGEALKNPQAKRGHSRDHRPDCKQVCIALVVTREGLPLGYEVFAGNTADVTTVQKIVEMTEARYGRAQRIWVMDRGMVSEKNLTFLRERKASYVLGTPKSILKQFERQLREGGWTQVRPDVEVKLCSSPSPGESFILCRSQKRKDKERAIRERFAARIQEGLESLGRRLAKTRRPVDRAQVERQMGRLLGRNTRAARSFDIRIDAAADQPSGLRLTWQPRVDWDAWAALSEGAYVLRTNLTGLSPEELWQIYVQLSDAEGAFRMHKSELRLRPIWHQREERVQAHILVCFLAYALYKTLEIWSARAGLGKSPRTLLEETARIQSTDVVLPTADGRELRLRCVVQPDRAQSILLGRLGLVLPKRLTPARASAQM